MQTTKTASVVGSFSRLSLLASVVLLTLSSLASAQLTIPKKVPPKPPAKPAAKPATPPKVAATPATKPATTTTTTTSTATTKSPNPAATPSTAKSTTPATATTTTGQPASVKSASSTTPATTTKQPGQLVNTAAPATAPGAVAPATATNMNNSANPMSPYTNGGAPSAGAAPGNTASSGAAGSPAAGGTLTQGNVVFTPGSCVHNGAKAVCTFTFANQGNAGQMNTAELAGAQFIDDAHVPHRADSRYYVDKYGTRQDAMFVNSGDSGTYVEEFSNVNSQVSTGEFHLGDQVVSGVSFGAPARTAAPAK